MMRMSKRTRQLTQLRSIEWDTKKDRCEGIQGKRGEELSSRVTTDERLGARGKGKGKDKEQ